MVNLENPLTRSTLRRPNKQFNFKADPEAVQVLTSGGIDLVNLANNHAMDYEAEGLIETLETLEKAGIHAIGVEAGATLLLDRSKVCAEAARLGISLHGQ